MIELIPVKTVLHSVMIYWELENIKDPLYRQERWDEMVFSALATHRDYVNKLLAWYVEIDEVQDWIICLSVHALGRLETGQIGSRGRYSVNMTESSKAQLREGFNKRHPDDALQQYRENVMKLMI